MPLVASVKAAKLNRMPCDHALERRALLILRCVDLWAPTAGHPIALGRMLAKVDWLRPADRWTGGDPPLVSLLDHLLKGVRYPLPAFLYPLVLGQTHPVWLTADAVLALGLLRFVGAGSPFREAPGIPRLTARESHLVWTTPHAVTVFGAVRRAQVLAAGGPEWLAQALGQTALGRPVRDEPHWARVIAWLAANHEGLDADRIGPIVDYLLSGSIVPTSLARLGREERRWHDRVALSRSGTAMPGPLPRSGFPDLDLEEAGARWSFREVHTGETLRAEGFAMQHCVATYGGAILAGRSSIWSMCLDRVRQLTIEVWNADRAVVQIRGYRNRRATPAELRVIGRWAASLELTVRDR